METEINNLLVKVYRKLPESITEKKWHLVTINEARELEIPCVIVVVKFPATFNRTFTVPYQFSTTYNLKQFLNNYKNLSFDSRRNEATHIYYTIEKEKSERLKIRRELWNFYTN